MTVLQLPTGGVLRCFSAGQGGVLRYKRLDQAIIIIFSDKKEEFSELQAIKKPLEVFNSKRLIRNLILF
jgi:hypothetical protein